MTASQLDSSSPPTRDPASHGRLLFEGAAILTPIATVVAWLLTLLPVEVPTAVENAIVGLIVTLGTLAFSELRNRQYADSFLPKAALIFIAVPLLCTACVTWNGDAFGDLARDEVKVLTATPQTARIDPERCKALENAAGFLRDEEGSSKSLKLPFFTGPKVASVAGSFERLSVVCFELALRDTEGALAPDLRGRNRDAWVRSWTSGRALLGGGE